MMNSLKYGHPGAIRAGLSQGVKSLVGEVYRRRVRSSLQLTSDEFWEYQLATFMKVYSFARARTPYYRENSGIYPEEIRGDVHILDLLKSFPILSKEQLRSNNELFFAERSKVPMTYHSTSGTTGTPLKIAASVAEKAFAQRVLDDWMERMSGQRDTRILYLSGFMTPSVEDSRIVWEDPLTRKAYLSIYSLDRDHKGEILDLLRRLRPNRILGYSTAINQLAQMFEVGELDFMKDGCVAFTTSANLYPNQREQIESTLCRRVYDQYGSQEGQHMVLECQMGRMHIHPLVGIVEILQKDGTPASAGEIGEVVVTGILRRSFPLIRYAIGDSAVSAGYRADCECGLGWPTIGQIEGRSDALVRTRSGGQVGHLVGRITKGLLGIRESQLVQHDYERFEFRIVPDWDAGYQKNTAEEIIVDRLSERLQSPVEVEFVYLEEIPRGNNGKFKSVVVEMSDGQ